MKSGKLSRQTCAHDFVPYACKQVHRLDGLLMSTVDSDEGAIVDLVLKQYVLALFHTKNLLSRLIKFGRKKFGKRRFVIAFQLGINEKVNTRNVPWAVVAEGDRDWDQLDWEPYNETTHIMVHLRVFYGRKDNVQLAKLNIFPRIDGRDNDLTKHT